MGFNKRYIGDQSLLAFARNEFESFNTYMLKADAYFLEGDMTSCFWNMYHEEREIREEIWKILRHEGEGKQNLTNGLMKAWSMSNSENSDSQVEGIFNYLDLLSASPKDPELNDPMNKICNALKRRIKNKK